MDDTPEFVKQKQLEIWLQKPPAERLKLTLQHNDELYKFWNTLKKRNDDKTADKTGAKY